MKKSISWLILSCLVVTALVLTSCQPAPTEEHEGQTIKGKVVEKEVTVEEKEEEVVAAPTGPQYGGILSYAQAVMPKHFDPYYFTGPLSSEPQSLWLEQLCMGDWAESGEDIAFWNSGYPPIEYATGMLAESWEKPDLETIIFHIRKGVRWHDKPPVNGRELTADDIVYTFERQYDISGGFKGKSLYVSRAQFGRITTMEATDRYTVVVKHKPDLNILHMFLLIGIGDQIVAREAVEQWGDLEDWRHAIGTGPFILEDVVIDSSLSLSKNPNYWGYDERHPENRLPYVDEIKVHIVPDFSTRLAALRAGKVATLDTDWEQGQTLLETNPELLQRYISGTGYIVTLRWGMEPYDDIRVRRALQMAIDLKLIAQTHFGGFVEPIPLPLCPLPGFYTPLEELPAEVQEGYSYNPEEAKQLLTEAGYPDGFKAKFVVDASSTRDLDLVMILKAYWADIGVDLEIRSMEMGALMSLIGARELEEMTFWPDMLAGDPTGVLTWYGEEVWWNACQIKDPVFNDLHARAGETLDRDEWRRLIREANDYSFAEQWVVRILPGGGFVFWQPWLKGYNGEGTLGLYIMGPILARIWIDQNLKYEMGR